MARADRGSDVGASDIVGKARQRHNRLTQMRLLCANKTNHPNAMIGLDKGGNRKGVVVPL